MRIEPTPLGGAFVVDIEPSPDARGLFARVFCSQEFQAHGLPTAFVQSSLSFNVRPGTLRGLHFQRAPHAEGKLVRCTRGAIHDVIVDLRPESPTHRGWLGVDLTQDNRRALYIPPGLAHGFVTLAPDSEVLYQMTEFFHPESAAGVRWNDPAFGIRWPVEQPFLSDRDAAYPDYRP